MRRNNDNGRVVGFKDGQPVYKKVNRGEQRDRKQGGRSDAGRQENGRRRGEDRGERRYNDRDRDGRYDGPEQYSGTRTYNKKGSPRNAEQAPRGGERREQYGRPYGEREGYRGERDYRSERGERDHRSDRGYRGERDERPERGYRPERADRPFRGYSPEEAPRFRDERLQRKADRMNEEGVRAPRERKQYDNFKPLPRDVEPAEEVELPNIIMGRNPVKEAIKTGRSIDRILVTNEHDGSLNEILDLAFEAKLVVRNVDRAKLDEIFMPFGHNGRTGNHQGIIAYVPEAQYCELSDILDHAKEKGEEPFVVLLDGIEDPHNLGSIIRSAECAGAHGIVIPKRRAASVTATVVKTSAGATEHMKIAKVVNLPVAIERLKEAGLWVAGADMGGEPMYSLDLKGPFALVVGAEGAGISRLVKEKCDYIVSVPLKGQMESLNASVAAAVIMFEKVRQENA